MSKKIVQSIGKNCIKFCLPIYFPSSSVKFVSLPHKFEKSNFQMWSIMAYGVEMYTNWSCFFSIFAVFNTISVIEEPIPKSTTSFPYILFITFIVS